MLPSKVRVLSADYEIVIPNELYLMFWVSIVFPRRLIVKKLERHNKVLMYVCIS
jgi:hypothetical protein